MDDLMPAPGQRRGQRWEEPLRAAPDLGPAECVSEGDSHGGQRRALLPGGGAILLPAMLKASVIVPARDASATLPRTLAALVAQQLDGDYEVIVVDDGSRDGTADCARAAPGVQLVSQPALGPAAARNAGIQVARAPALAFCDADVFPSSGWLAAGLSALKHLDVVQGKVLPDPDAALGPFDRTIWITSEVGLFETANLFVRRETLARVGGFEEWIRPRRGKALAEDVWFGYRALRGGARSGFCAEALAHHAVFPRSWPGYVAERARLRFFPAMADKMPELRRRFLFRRVFLNPRSARFDLAVAAGATAAARRSVLPLVGALPYLRVVARDAARAPAGVAPRPGVAAADVAADVVGLAALLSGSVRYRSPVI
jgi:GT2 family glycosyltransferase